MATNITTAASVAVAFVTADAIVADIVFVDWYWRTNTSCDPQKYIENLVTEKTETISTKSKIIILPINGVHVHEMGLKWNRMVVAFGRRARVFFFIYFVSFCYANSKSLTTNGTKKWCKKSQWLSALLSKKRTMIVDKFDWTCPYFGFFHAMHLIPNNGPQKPAGLG